MGQSNSLIASFPTRFLIYLKQQKNTDLFFLSFEEECSLLNSLGCYSLRGQALDTSSKAVYF